MVLPFSCYMYKCFPPWWTPLSMAPQVLSVEYIPCEGLGNCAMCTFSSLFSHGHHRAHHLFISPPTYRPRKTLHFMGLFDHTNNMVKGLPFCEFFIQIGEGGVEIFMASSLSQFVLVLNAKTIFWTTLPGLIEGNQPNTKGHSTHKNEGLITPANFYTIRRHLWL